MKNKNGEAANEAIQTVKKLYEMIASEAQKIAAFDRQKEHQFDIFDAPVCYEMYPSKDELKSLRGEKGVYIFRVKNAQKLTRDEIKKWNEEKGANFLPIYGGPASISFCANDVLYIGSCYSKSLLVRMQEHYGDYKPGLQLNAAQRTVLRDNVRAYAFPIKKGYLQKDTLYAKMILPVIEKELHNLLHPKTGSTRT